MCYGRPAHRRRSSSKCMTLPFTICEYCRGTFRCFGWVWICEVVQMTIPSGSYVGEVKVNSCGQTVDKVNLSREGLHSRLIVLRENGHRHRPVMSTVTWKLVEPKRPRIGVVDEAVLPLLGIMLVNVTVMSGNVWHCRLMSNSVGKCQGAAPQSSRYPLEKNGASEVGPVDHMHFELLEKSCSLL
jgi:hypothetical protein